MSEWPRRHAFGFWRLADGSYRIWLPRRLVLSRWSLRGKYWLNYRLRSARLRALYWHLIRNHETEICGRCGGPVQIVFHTPDHIWELATGNARDPGGESGGGVLCPPCVDALVEPKVDGYLTWTCEVTR